MVCILEDGTVVQDYPTFENDDTNIPYPIFLEPDWPLTYTTNFDLTVDKTYVQNPVVKTFYGGHVYEIDQDMAALLTSAGYGAWVT